MSKKFKKIVSLLCASLMMMLMAVPVSATMRYTGSNMVYFYLTFSSASAGCDVRITGAEGTTSITDCTVKLTDSNGNTVKTWTGLSTSGKVLNFSGTASGVTKGETYTLSVRATVNRNNTIEIISDSFTKTYN